MSKNLTFANLSRFFGFYGGEGGNGIDSAQDRITNLVLTAGQQVPQFEAGQSEVVLSIAKNYK